MPYSDYLKTRALHFRSQNLSLAVVVQRLKDEGLTATRQGLWKIYRNVDTTGSITRRPGSGRESVLTGKIRAIIEGQMQSDDETTAIQLQALLVSHGHTLSLSTILRCRQQLGWTFRGSAYCQLVCTANKEKCLKFARDYLHEAETGFNNVIFSDETSIQLETHRRFCCRKWGQRPKGKPW